MERILCLGWGSLIWSPRNLPVATAWYEDGPRAPVEFLRESSGGRLTLVLHEKGTEVRLRWAALGTTELDHAWEELRAREGVSPDRPEWVGLWRPGEPSPARVPGLAAWARRRDADAVLWTALPARFGGVEGAAPGVNEAVSFLRERSREGSAAAREYVERAPPQTDTRYRRRFERELGWEPR